jgi:hypothetical protein
MSNPPRSAIALSRIGRFEVRGQIGAGGMGEVYRAWDSRLEREVAVKTLRAAIGCTPAALQRFAREAKAASALDQPNIVTIYDVGEADGQPFLIMELLEGQDLRRELRAPLGLEQLLRLGAQIADALTGHRPVREGIGRRRRVARDFRNTSGRRPGHRVGIGRRLAASRRTRDVHVRCVLAAGARPRRKRIAAATRPDARGARTTPGAGHGGARRPA